MSGAELVVCRTFHGRRGAIRNAFAYGIDYVLLDAEASPRTPLLFSCNRRNVMSVRDRDHGGAPGRGSGAAWVRNVIGDTGLAPVVRRIELLAQPRVLGHIFNPVSFWLLRDARNDLRAVIAEVNNTFGDRHCYLCHNPGYRPIAASDTIRSGKIFHVSPFQDVKGEYRFRFDIAERTISILIDYRTETGEGVVATLEGARKPLRNRAILGAMLSRPLGSRRVLGLIHWQAMRLWWKGAAYRPRPAPPDRGLS